MKDKKDYQQISEAYTVINEWGDKYPSTPENDPREHRQEIEVFDQLVTTVKHVHNHIKTDVEAFEHITGWDAFKISPLRREDIKKMTSVAWMWWVQHHQGIDEPPMGVDTPGSIVTDLPPGKGPPKPGIEGPDFPPLPWDRDPKV
jgi:hypothetical protein